MGLIKKIDEQQHMLLKRKAYMCHMYLFKNKNIIRMQLIAFKVYKKYTANLRSGYHYQCELRPLFSDQRSLMFLSHLITIVSSRQIQCLLWKSQF